MNTYADANSSPNQPLPTVSIVGARGYAGLELAKILLQHPQVVLTHCFATQNFRLADDLFSEKASKVICLPESELMANLTDIVFLATPAEVSLRLAPQILAQGRQVIDLSGAFRLKKTGYQKWYGFAHTERQLLDSAHYGLVPFADAIDFQTNLIANPGCYATAISLALIPLLKKNLIQADSLVIDAKSGTTGAGRKAAENILFSEVDGECLPYRIGRHQHLPEIQETVHKNAGCIIDPHFSTHLLPTKRGIVAGIYATTSVKSTDEITAAYREAFADYPLVRFGTNVSKLGSLNKVVGTPFTHISYDLVENKLYVFSCLDNLLKGAASQAVENLNRLYGFAVTSGLYPQEVL